MSSILSKGPSKPQEEDEEDHDELSEYEEIRDGLLEKNEPLTVQQIVDLIEKHGEDLVAELGEYAVTPLMELAAKAVDNGNELLEIAVGLSGLVMVLSQAAGFMDENGDLTPDFPPPAKPLLAKLAAELAARRQAQEECVQALKEASEEE